MTSDSDTPQKHASDDPLDALLASRPVRPASDFVDRTLARIALDAEAADPEVDALLASRPVCVSPGFAGRVMSDVAAARRRRLFVRIGAPFAAVACLALAVLPALLPSGNGGKVGEQVRAALAADSELNALASLPASNGSDSLKTEDLATLADLGTLFAEDSNDYAL